MALSKTLNLLEVGIDAGLHLGAQLFVSLRGETVADLAVGEAQPGRAMRADDLVLWLSSTKPTAAVALARLWEAGALDLDDPVARFIPEFAAGGKAGVTLRHLLTHTSGIRMLDVGWPRESWEAVVARIAARKLEPRWDPGRKAGYHMASSWFILGEVVRRIDGRPYERFVREEVFLPLGMADSWVGMPPERYFAYGERIVPMFNTEVRRRRAGGAGGGGETGDRPAPPEHRWHREEWVTHASPGGNGRGPIRELGRFYETLLAGGLSPATGRRLLTPQTVEALTARHRVGLYDHTFRHVMDWGLGFIVNSATYDQAKLPYAYGPHASRRTYGHSGYRSSTAFADPEHRLAVALATNGTPADEAHLERMESLCATIYQDLGLTGSA
ncbi:MAG TPA: serine hydrolase domain-containing protein [Thermoanaerobaculia bacterium]|nr:serine hydrolase domain-containing protein [Thermoanaerobaculia bacterium]